MGIVHCSPKFLLPSGSTLHSALFYPSQKMFVFFWVQENYDGTRNVGYVYQKFGEKHNDWIKLLVHHNMSSYEALEDAIDVIKKKVNTEILKEK